MITFNFLLVDDEKPFIETLAQRLRRRGFIVNCVFSGLEALNYLEKDKAIDIVVMDVKMPDPDGIKTIKELKKKYPLVEVIMLTGNATIDSAIDAMKIGAFDYLIKPCELNHLISKAEKAVARKKEREGKIFDVRTTPYITQQERDELIAKIMDS